MLHKETNIDRLEKKILELNKGINKEEKSPFLKKIENNKEKRLGIQEVKLNKNMSIEIFKEKVAKIEEKIEFNGIKIKEIQMKNRELRRNLQRLKLKIENQELKEKK